MEWELFPPQCITHPHLFTISFSMPPTSPFADTPTSAPGSLKTPNQCTFIAPKQPLPPFRFPKWIISLTHQILSRAAEPIGTPKSCKGSTLECCRHVHPRALSMMGWQFMRTSSRAAFTQILICGIALSMSILSAEACGSLGRCLMKCPTVMWFLGTR